MCIRDSSLSLSPSFLQGTVIMLIAITLTTIVVVVRAIGAVLENAIDLATTTEVRVEVVSIQFLHYGEGEWMTMILILQELVDLTALLIVDDNSLNYFNLKV